MVWYSWVTFVGFFVEVHLHPACHLCCEFDKHTTTILSYYFSAIYLQFPLLDQNIHIYINLTHINTILQPYCSHTWQPLLQHIIFYSILTNTSRHWQETAYTYAIADNIYAIGDNVTLPIISFLFHHKWHYSLGLYDSEICHRHSPRPVWSFQDTITLSHEYSHDIIWPFSPLCTLVLNLHVDSLKCSSFGASIVHLSPQPILKSIILILLHCR